MPKHGVLVDVDGTLVDTNYIHALCWHDALRGEGVVVPMARLHRAVGMGADRFLDHVLGELPGMDADRCDRDAITDAHKTLYRQHWERLTPLPSAAHLLRTCATMGLVIVLASSADEHELGALRAVLDCDDVIAAATNASDVGQTKPDPELISLALDKVGLVASDAVFVGDSVWDGQAAVNAGMPFIAVECGGTSATELHEAGAIEVWRDPADLLVHLHDSKLGRM